MQTLFGVPPTRLPATGGSTKPNIPDLKRCDACGWGYPGPACNSPQCNQPIAAAATQENVATVEEADTRYASMVRFERLAKKLLASDHNIGCVYRSELPEDCVLADYVLGATGSSLHLPLRERVPFLRDVDRVIIFNSANILAEFGVGGGGLNAVYLHELAHAACSLAVSSEKLPDATTEANWSEFSRLQLAAPPIAAVVFDEFEQHPEVFWRAATHLVDRACRADLDFDLSYTHGRYGLDAEKYWNVLGGEIELYRGESLVDVLRDTEPPQEFLDLFNDDVARLGFNN